MGVKHYRGYARLVRALRICDDEGKTWGEDIDNDGYFETIIENELPNGGLVRTVIEEDGTMYVTQFSPSGEVIHKWKTVPPEKEGEEPKNYVWDEKTKQWLPDQDMDGIPDAQEEQNDNQNNPQSNNSGSTSGGYEGGGGGGGGNKAK
jgi:hypothetical protein